MALSHIETKVDSHPTIDSIEEISIIVAARDLTPTMMSLDFLKFSGIIPKDWELSKPPVLNPNLAQLSFKNGVNITAQPRTITFAESLNAKELDEINSPLIVVKYLEKLPHAEFIGLSFCPKILIPFPDSPEKPRQFITETLLNSGAWKNIGQFPVQAGINLMYLLDRCQLNVNVAEARLQQPQMPPLTALLFSGNFNYDVSQKAEVAQPQHLIELANCWREDLMAFREIVEEKFLVSANGVVEESVFPGTLL